MEREAANHTTDNTPPLEVVSVVHLTETIHSADTRGALPSFREAKAQKLDGFKRRGIRSGINSSRACCRKYTDSKISSGDKDCQLYGARIQCTNCGTSVSSSRYAPAAVQVVFRTAYIGTRLGKHRRDAQERSVVIRRDTCVPAKRRVA